MKINRIFLLVDLTWLNVILRMIYLYYVLYIYTKRYSVILVSLLLHIKLWYTLLLENFIKFFPSCICRWPLLEIITSSTCDFSNNCLDEQNWYFEGVFLVSITFDSCKITWFHQNIFKSINIDFNTEGNSRGTQLINRTECINHIDCKL